MRAGEPHSGVEIAAVMFHAPRTGSTVVCEMLERHPAVTWRGEALHRLLRRRDHGAGPLARGRHPVAVLLRKIERAESPVAGFEIVPQDLVEIGVEPAEFVARLVAVRPFRFVLLRRRNLLRGVISTLAATATGQWQARSGERIPPPPVAFDPAGMQCGRLSGTLLEILDHIDGNNAAVEAACTSEPFLELVYEDDVEDDPARAYTRLCNFLGVEPIAAPPAYVRLNSSPLRDRLAEPAEVERALAGTRFAWMLDA